MKKYFALTSTETRFDKIGHRCKFERPIIKENDYPKILVSIDPPIPAYFYNRLNKDLSSAVLAPRLEGSSVYPEISNPCFVYVCIPKEGGSWDSGPWEILDWAEIK